MIDDKLKEVTEKELYEMIKDKINPEDNVTEPVRSLMLWLTLTEPKVEALKNYVQLTTERGQPFWIRHEVIDEYIDIALDVAMDNTGDREMVLNSVNLLSKNL